MNSLDLTFGVADEPLGHKAILAGIMPEDSGSLLLTVIQAMDLGPLRPRIVGRAGFGQLRQNFKLHQTPAAMAHRRTNAVCASIAAANYDHVLVLCRNVVSVLMIAV